MTIPILTGSAALVLIAAMILMRHLERKAQERRAAQFEQEDAIRIRDAAKERQDWIAGVMKEYNAPVPTGNVPTTR